MVTTADQPEVESTMRPEPDADVSFRQVDDPIELQLPPEWRLTDDALFELYELNASFNFERTAKGNLVIVPSPHGPSPAMGPEISYQLLVWVKAGGGGEVRDASGGYKLGETPPPEQEEMQPVREPDVSWLSQDQLDGIAAEDYEEGLEVPCPRFVVEIISAKQSVAPQKRKMREWMSYGVQLGWLIDRKHDKAWIYRAGQAEPDELDRPATLSGENVLDGFELDCSEIWK